MTAEQRPPHELAELVVDLAEVLDIETGLAEVLSKTRLDNPPACGAPSNWPWGYLSCGCCNDGHGRHVR